MQSHILHIPSYGPAYAYSYKYVCIFFDQVGRDLLYSLISFFADITVLSLILILGPDPITLVHFAQETLNKISQWAATIYHYNAFVSLRQKPLFSGNPGGGVESISPRSLFSWYVLSHKVSKARGTSFLKL